MKKLTKFTPIVALITIITLALTGCGPSEEELRIMSCVDDNDTALTKGGCIMDIALEKETEEEALVVCDQILNGVRNTCERNVAVKFENKDLCFENDNEIETYICLANLAEKQKDPSLCPAIARKKDEEFCYRKVAVATLDESHCENIVENEEFRTTCIESVEFARTVQNESSESATQVEFEATTE